MLTLMELIHFTYTITDADGDTDTATVTNHSSNSVDDAPDAVDDTATVNEDASTNDCRKHQ